ncbi:MAG: class I SAM-dependent methyltransferase, partial [Deltaproteobacteria bacterium]|nr:class I SAM-dependent methyltransferase [Deltaproteobacteria bacterium]
AVDGSQEMIDAALDLHPELTNHLRQIILQQDLHKLYGNYDGVYSIAALMHLTETELIHVTSRIAGLIKSRGFFFFTVSIERDDTNDSGYNEELIIDGLYEEERKLEKINIFTFEKEFPDHLSEEQLARELFVSTGTVKKWIKNHKITPDVTVPFGKKELSYFAPHQLDHIIKTMNLRHHDNTTQYDDFFEFINEGDYTMSYKIIMMLSMLSIVDNTGECNLDKLLDLYIKFYRDRIKLGLAVDRENCPYNNSELLEDRSIMKKSLLQNPFEKFERKRFMYHCKDLNHISFSTTLWNILYYNNDISRIKEIYLKDLLSYYEKLGGVPNKEDLVVLWKIHP